MNLPTKLDVEQWRLQRLKKVVLVVCQQLYLPEAARKVVPSDINVKKSISDLNMWQIENLTQHQEKCEHQIKDKFNQTLPDYHIG